MHLALTPHRQLRRCYGAHYPEIAAALDEALQARISAGISTLAYDPEAGVPDLGIAATTLTPGDLSAQLSAIERAFMTHNGIMIRSLWIVGGPEVVPFGTLPNPMQDHDGPILSDCVYGLANEADLLTRWPVGRTPDPRWGNQPGLAQVLRRIATTHRSGRHPAGTTLGISTARWATISRDILTGSEAADAQLLLAPPLQAGQIDRRQIHQARWIYCNLHGVTGSTTWYGQAAQDNDLTPALRPDDLAGLDLVGCVVISQACFGAKLQATRDAPGMAAALLAAGASLIGAIGLAYGSPDPPASDSDLL
ncbi:MAG: hypothetical protein HGA65_20160, partial [Oscillochloris sp.]|nr:hypothetical protein [Oscillochloris sp.]